MEKFNGRTNVSIWQRRRKDLLIQQGVSKTLLWKAKMPEKMKEDDREDKKDERLTIGMNVSKGLPPNKD